jgi:hypothetical protein
MSMSAADVQSYIHVLHKVHSTAHAHTHTRTRTRTRATPMPRLRLDAHARTENDNSSGKERTGSYSLQVGTELS